MQWLRDTLAKHSVVYESCKTEEGEGQVEIALTPRAPLKAAEECVYLKKLIMKEAKIDARELSFDAKPYEDSPPSALHVHVSMHNTDDKPVYFKRDEEISEVLQYSIGGLLETIPEGMQYFVPTAKSYKRFIGASQTTPHTISWGANNRTTAIRLPDIGAPYRHIEHRVAGADADPMAVIYWIMHGIAYGLDNKSIPIEQYYGNANSATNLVRIPIKSAIR